MAMQRPSNGRTGAQRLFSRWHRRIGMAAAVLVLLLALTGILLSHADKFALYDTTVAHPWVARVYDAELHAPPRAVETAAGWVVWIDGDLYLDGAPLAGGFEMPIGTAAADSVIAVAAPGELLIFNPLGEIVERLGAASLPGRIEAIGGTENGAAAVKTADAIFTTRDFLDWRPDIGASVRWNGVLADAPQTIVAPALAAHRGAGVALHRIVADIHSGRILGSWGPYLMDAAAIALIILVISGFINWRGRRRD
jgi:hypothetical protein